MDATYSDTLHEFDVSISKMTVNGFDFRGSHEPHPMSSNWGVPKKRLIWGVNELVPKLYTREENAEKRRLLHLRRQDISGALVFESRWGGTFVVVFDVRLNCPGVSIFIPDGVWDMETYSAMTTKTVRKHVVSSRLSTGHGIIAMMEVNVFGNYEVDISFFNGAIAKI